jgi:peroxiredoxin Q/BCP
MTHLSAGDQAPDFSLPSDDREESLSLADFKGQKLVIFFYPKDNTPGCTAESCDFRDLKAAFGEYETNIVGVSKNSLKDHVKFREKQDLNFPLLSDENGTMCEDYGVWVEKSMYGKTYMGIERTTFLIDENGFIQNIWSKVKVKGHVDDVLESVKALKKAA